MSAFNLNDLLNQRSKDMAAEENKKPGEKGVTFVDVRELIPSEDNFYHVDTELKESIEVFGILQPLLVQKKDDGYHVIAGHRRRLAVLELVSEGKEQFARVPVMLYDSETDALDRLALIVANRFREKTDWEKMKEAVETEKLVKDVKEEMNIPGKTRELVSQILDTSVATFAKYKAVANNLNDELMKAFKEQKFNITVAYDASTLDEDQQEEARAVFEENGTLTTQDIKSIKNPVPVTPETPAEIPASAETVISGDASDVFAGDTMGDTPADDTPVTGNPTEADYALEEAERIFREGNSDPNKDTDNAAPVNTGNTERNAVDSNNDTGDAGAEDTGYDEDDDKTSFQVLVHAEKTIKATSSDEAEKRVRDALKNAGYTVTDITVLEA